MVVLVRDPLGEWRDEALVATDPTVSAAFVIQGYCRRWSVELAFFDSKQYLGLHDPQVWSERSVERAHPMAWFVGSLTILWYCLKGHEGSHVVRDRPWYTNEGHTDVHRHAGCVTAADVGIYAASRLFLTIRTALITSLAAAHIHTRSWCRTQAGSGDKPLPNDVRTPNARSMSPRIA